MYKRLIIILLILSIGIVFIGCSNKNPVPDGVGQGFYEDMTVASNLLIKDIRNSKDCFEIGDESYYYVYKYNDSDLTFIESAILESFEDLIIWTSGYHWGYKYTDNIEKALDTFTRLMNIEIDINDLILK